MSSKTQVSSRLLAIKLISIAMSTSACGVATHSGDAISLTGSPEGIRAMSDLLAGVATNAKASADAPDTPYYQLRRTQEQIRPLYTGRARMPQVGGNK